MDTPATEIRTPLIRLITGAFCANVGYGMATMVTLQLLLTFKLNQIDPQNVMVDLSLITGVAVLFALVGNPIGGALSDRTQLNFGRRRTWIIIGTVLGGMCLMGIAFATKLWMVLAFWCGAQAFYNFSMAATTALIADQVDESKRGGASGVVSLAGFIGVLVGLALMNALSSMTLVIRFAMLVGISLILSLICCILIKESKVIYKKAQEEKKPFKITSIYPSPRKYPNFTWAWITRFFIFAAYSYSVYNVIIFERRFGFSEAQVSEKMLTLTAVSTLFTVIASLLGGFISDKLRKQKLFVMLSAFIVSVGLVIVAFSSNFNMFMFGSVVIGMGFGIYLAVDLALNTRILPSQKDAAKDLGIINIAATLPQSIVPVFAPVVLAGWGFVGFFLLFAGFAVVSGLAVGPIPEMPSTSSDGISTPEERPAL